MQAHGAEQERLTVLVGRWTTKGRTRPTADATAATIRATDTYEWLPGRFALLHTVDARVGDEHVEGAEIIGWHPARRLYLTQYFGSDGPNAYEAELDTDEGALVWRMRSHTDRFTGTFSADRTTITGHWEQRAGDATWRPWMDITLTKQRP
jgi:uncharacterized protein DUF1579